MQTKSVLLEPYYEYRLIVPETSIGRAMTDIERMAGSFTLQQNLPQTNGEGHNRWQFLPEKLLSVPCGIIRRKSPPTQKDMDSCSARFLGYRPCHNADEVIAAKQVRC